MSVLLCVILGFEASALPYVQHGLTQQAWAMQSEPVAPSAPARPAALLSFLSADHFGIELNNLLSPEGTLGSLSTANTGFVKNGESWLKVTCKNKQVFSRVITAPGSLFIGCSVTESQGPSVPTDFVLSPLVLFEIAAKLQAISVLPAASSATASTLASTLVSDNGTMPAFLYTLAPENSYAQKLNRFLLSLLPAVTSAPGSRGAEGVVENGDTWLKVVCTTHTRTGGGRVVDATVVKFMGCTVAQQVDAPTSVASVVLPLDLLKIGVGISAPL